MTDFYSEYLENHKTNTEKNIDELMNYDKNKLIKKILLVTKSESKDNLEKMDFSELWDKLIDRRVLEYTKTFKDGDYEKILKKIFNENTLYNSQPENDNYIENTIANNSRDLIIRDLRVNNILLYGYSYNTDLVIIKDLVSIIKSNNTIDIIQSSQENLLYHAKHILEYLITEEKIKHIYGSNNDDDVTGLELMRDWIYIISELFGYKPENDENYTIDLRIFLEASNEWFFTILVCYAFEKIGEDWHYSWVKLHDTILNSEIFTKPFPSELGHSDRFNTIWDFLSKFVEFIIIPFLNVNQGIDFIEEFKKLLKLDDSDDYYPLLDLFTNPEVAENYDYLWETERRESPTRGFVNVSWLTDNIFNVLDDFDNEIDEVNIGDLRHFVLFISMFEVFYERSLNTEPEDILQSRSE